MGRWGLGDDRRDSGDVYANSLSCHSQWSQQGLYLIGRSQWYQWSPIITDSGYYVFMEG